MALQNTMRGNGPIRMRADVSCHHHLVLRDDQTFHGGPLGWKNIGGLCVVRVPLNSVPVSLMNRKRRLTIIKAEAVALLGASVDGEKHSLHGPGDDHT